jgi:hypothetical protein
MPAVAAYSGPELCVTISRIAAATASGVSAVTHSTRAGKTRRSRMRTTRAASSRVTEFSRVAVTRPSFHGAAARTSGGGGDAGLGEMSRDLVEGVVRGRIGGDALRRGTIGAVVEDR